MGKRSRDKGAAWERKVANDLTRATGVKCRRNLIETQQGNQGDIATPLPMSVQCKVGVTPPVWSAMDQAVASADTGHVPVAILKKNGSRGTPPMEVAVLPVENFYELLTMWTALGTDPLLRQRFKEWIREQKAKRGIEEAGEGEAASGED